MAMKIPCSSSSVVPGENFVVVVVGAGGPLVPFVAAHPFVVAQTLEVAHSFVVAQTLEVAHPFVVAHPWKAAQTLEVAHPWKVALPLMGVHAADACEFDPQCCTLV